MQSFDRQLQLIDTRLFKAFIAAAEAQNFTSAAQAAYMTQSGISQHIAKLESQIGVPLFKRIGKRVTLTESGRLLKRFIRDHANFTESFLDSLRTEHEAIAGACSYAMPASCLLSPHFPMMLEKRKAHPGVRINVTLAPSPEVIEMLLADKIDFGFVTYRADNPSLNFQYFCSEEYILAGAEPHWLNQIDAGSLLSLPFIHYPGVDVYFEQWSRHHFKDSTEAVEFPALNITGRFSSIEGAIKMVEGGLGISIFPRHCIADQLMNGQLTAHHAAPPLQNAIYIVTVKDHHYPRVVRQVLDWFFAMHADGPIREAPCAEHFEEATLA